MPTYVYYCENEECGHEEEIYLRHVLKDDSEINDICPKCGKKMIRDIFPPVGMKMFGLGNFDMGPGYNNEMNFRRKKKAEKNKNEI